MTTTKKLTSTLLILSWLVATSGQAIDENVLYWLSEGNNWKGNGNSNANKDGLRGSHNVNNGKESGNGQGIGNGNGDANGIRIRNSNQSGDEFANNTDSFSQDEILDGNNSLSLEPMEWKWDLVTNESVDVTDGATVFTDLTQDLNFDNPSLKENLLDGDPNTVFAMYRVEDYVFQVRLGQPSVVSSIEILQPWDDWAKPTSLRVSNAAGEIAEIESLDPSRRNFQTLELDFTKPTDILDIEITSASASSLDWYMAEYFGGLAELRVNGYPVAEDDTRKGPIISKVNVEKQNSGRRISLRWETDVPATSQVHFRNRRGVQWEHGDNMLRTEHSVTLDASSSPISGLLRLRSLSSNGRSSEHWDDTLTDAGKLEEREFMFGLGADHPESSTSHGSPSDIREMGMRNDFVNSWISRQNEWRDWLPSFLDDAKRAGHQAQILHWFYGDDPKKAEVLSTREDYRQSIRDMDRMIQESGLGSDAVVTLEPEYNSPTGDLADWDGWNDIIIDAIDIIKSGSGAQVCVYAGWWDSQNFVPISLGRAAMYADCASTMKMAASVDTTEPEYAGRERKARTAVTDAIRFSHFLRRNFMIPVRWDYFLVSEYGGWERIQKEVMTDLCNRISEIQESGVIGIAWMSYQDSRDQHNMIYGEAEYHKGLVDRNGNKKPNAWDIWNTCGGI